MIRFKKAAMFALSAAMMFSTIGCSGSSNSSSSGSDSSSSKTVGSDSSGSTDTEKGRMPRNFVFRSKRRRAAMRGAFLFLSGF